MSFTPRPYQLDAIEALRKGWADGTNRLAVVLPTGAGKTVVFSTLAHQMLDSLGGRPRERARIARDRKPAA